MNLVPILVECVLNAILQGLLVFSSVYMVTYKVKMIDANTKDLSIKAGFLVCTFSFATGMLQHANKIVEIVGSYYT